jgi:hypothetical protein
MININYIKSNGELKRLKELSSIECESPLTIEELQQEIDAYALENEEANKTAQQKELEKIGEYYFQRIETLKAAGQDASGLISEQAAKEQEVRDKFAQERLAKEREIEDIRLMANTAGLPALQAQYEIEKVELQRQYEDKIALAKKNGEDVTGLEAEYQQKQLEAAAAFQQARINQSLDAASGWLTSLSQLNNAFEVKTEAVATTGVITFITKEVGTGGGAAADPASGTVLYLLVLVDSSKR